MLAGLLAGLVQMICHRAHFANPATAYRCLTILADLGWLVGEWRVVKCECGRWYLSRLTPAKNSLIIDE